MESDSRLQTTACILSCHCVPTLTSLTCTTVKMLSAITLDQAVIQDVYMKRRRGAKPISRLACLTPPWSRIYESKDPGCLLSQFSFEYLKHRKASGIRDTRTECTQCDESTWPRQENRVNKGMQG